MRLEIRSAFGDSRQIDTRDLDMMARWIVQTLLDFQPTPQMPAMVQAWPQWAPSADGGGRADWIADSRVIGYIKDVQTPGEVVAYLGEQVRRQQELAARDELPDR